MKAYRASLGILVAFALVVGISSSGIGALNSDDQPARSRWARPFGAELTEEQREAVHEKIAQMRSQGASRQEIHNAVAEMLQGYGIEVPEKCGEGHPPGSGRGRGPLGDPELGLTDEQRAAIHEKVREMRDQGSSRQEIHDAVGHMLQSYGVQLPENWNEEHSKVHGRRLGHLAGIWHLLSDAEQETLRTKIRGMMGRGATREEIHHMVENMLQEFSITMPEDNEGHHPSRKHGHLGHLWPLLSDGERETLRARIREMMSQGATREEIHQAVEEMLRGFGIELPRENSSSETSTGKSPIRAQSSPNPFNPATQITYTLNAPGTVKLCIYNVAGQMVRSFDLGYKPAGSYTVKWDGRYKNGDQAASGVYLYRIEAGPHVVTNRMVLLK